MDKFAIVHMTTSIEIGAVTEGCICMRLNDFAKVNFVARKKVLDHTAFITCTVFAIVNFSGTFRLEL